MKKSLRLLILLLLALLIPTTSLPVFSLEIFSAATAPTVTQLSISGAPEDLTSGQLLPQPQLTLLADNPCAIVPLDSTGETVRWYAGQASEPLPLDTIVQAGQTYWMELLVRPAQGETIDPAQLRCTVNAVSPSISETEDGVLLRICYSASTSQPVNSVFPFTDIPRSSWYYDSVSWAYHHALVAGTSATGFSPAGTTTRAMLVTLLYASPVPLKIATSIPLLMFPPAPGIQRQFAGRQKTALLPACPQHALRQTALSHGNKWPSFSTATPSSED